MTTATEAPTAPKKATKAGATPEELPEAWRVKLHGTQPVVTLNANQIIWDDEFNYTRQRKAQCSPFDLDKKFPGEADSLAGKIGENTPVDFAVYDPIARFATQEERDRWLELHAQDEWFQAIPEDQRKSYIPTVIVVDGFGRCEDEWRRKGPAHELSFKLLNTSDKKVAIWIALILNTSQRQPSPFDLADSFKQLQQEFGWNRAELSRRLGFSKAHVTQIMKCHELPADIRAKAVKENWALLTIRKYVDRMKGVNQNADKGAWKPDVMKGKARQQVKANINAFLEAGVVKKGSRPEAFLQGFLAAMEFSDGDYQKSDGIEDILAMGDIDLNALPYAVDEAPPKEDKPEVAASEGAPTQVKKKSDKKGSASASK